MSDSINTLRIATRRSALAMWQAEHIRDRIEAVYPALQIELVTFTTRGDKILDTPLAKVGGKGLFVKELETALLEGAADIAVHSMKDVPMEFPPGLHLPVICERENPADALVSNRFHSIDELREGAVVGTSSLRRQCQLAEIRPDLRIESLRGNVNTRLQKLDDGEFDAIVLAGSGLIRLGFSGRIAQMLPAETMLPAGGQGALGIETRVEDSRINELIGFLNHQSSALCVRAERAMNRRLEGGCQVPIAAYAELSEAKLGLRGLVGSIDGETILRANLEGDTGNPEQIGINLAEKLLSMGAGEILREIYASGPDSGVKATSGRDS